MSDQARRNTRVERERRYPPGYGVVEPVANYRPWDTDAAFQEVYELVREHTMVDVYRLWTLWFIAHQLADDPRAAGAGVPGDVLEVGSWRGGSGAVLGRALAEGAGGTGGERAGAPSAASARTIFLADTFAGVVKAGTRDTYYKGGEHANTSVDTVQELLARVGVTNVELLAGIFPDDRGEEIADRRFLLCHIDVDVYQSARDTFEWVWPRMVRGGVVIFDDYGFYGCEGVTSYVNELASGAAPVPQGDAVGQPTVIPSLSGQAIVTRTS